MSAHCRKHLPILLAVLLAAAFLCTACSSPAVSFKPGQRTETQDTKQYINESLGLSFTLPEGWRFYTDTELQNLMSISSGAIGDPGLLEDAGSGTLYEFIAAHTGIGDMITVTADYGNAGMSLERYIKVYRKTLTNQLTNATCTVAETTEMVKIGQEIWTYLTADMTVMGISTTQYAFFLKCDEAIVTITVSDVSGETASFYEGLFTRMIPGQNAG
ncbi:MAG: hypothetical protein MJ192_07660 [Clostridia bacterium]|nr:hypothetical protein [Clostridia bacterium]